MRSRQPLVVVVEDDPDMNRAMESVLQAAGFETAMYSSAEALLQAVPSATACFVLDVQLPGLTGFELYDRLAATSESRPVIFVTGFDDPAARARSEKAGALAYFTKPFAGRKLIEALDRVTRRRVR